MYDKDLKMKLPLSNFNSNKPLEDEVSFRKCTER